MKIQYNGKEHEYGYLIDGYYKYIGMICKKSKKPSGLGRLIYSSSDLNNIQEGIFKNGDR
jgi:hypothetical protein